MATLKYVGTPTLKVDIIPRVTGTAQYTDDFALPPRTVHAVLVQSPYAHANILSIDSSAAEAVPGVLAVFDHRHPGVQYRWNSGDRTKTRMLFNKTLRYVGEPVALVVALDRYTAEDAAQLVEVEYEVLPHVLDPKEALQPGAPILHADEDMETNELISRGPYERGDIEQGFAEADFVIEETFYTPFVHNNQMEIRAALALWEGDELTLWTPTQGITNCRSAMARDLGIPESKVRVICQYMGGGFGNKNGNQNIDVMVAAAAKVLGRPVKIWMGRTVDMTEMHGRWPGHQHYKIGFTKDGRVTAVDFEAWSGLGAWRKSSGYIYGAREMLDVDNVRADIHAVYTNHQNVGNFRAPPDPQGVFSMATMIDVMAETLKVDGREIPEFNIQVATKQADQEEEYTSYNLPVVIRKGAEVVGWRDNWHSPGARQLDDGRYHGMGMAWGTWGAGLGLGSATIKINSDGTAHLLVGVTDIGTGAKTTQALFAAEALGIPPEKIKVTSGDTDVTGYSVGESGSRSTGHTAPAVLQAGYEAKLKLMELALEILNAEGAAYTVEDLEAENEVIFVRDNPDLQVPYADAASLANDAILASAFTRERVPRGLAREAWIAGFAEVAVDREIGRIDLLRYVSVHDSGQIVNPLAAQSQVLGGVTMGIGGALLEELIWDPATGAHVNPNYHDVRIASHMDYGKIEVVFVGEGDPGFVPEPYGPLGTKPIGEPPIVPVYGAIANAVYNAIGVRITRTPMNPHTVLAALAG